MVVRVPVYRPGLYAVTVNVRSAARRDTVDLYVGNAPARRVATTSQRASRVVTQLELSGTLTIRAVDRRAHPVVQVAARPLSGSAQSPASPPSTHPVAPGPIGALPGPGSTPVLPLPGATASGLPPAPSVGAPAGGDTVSVTTVTGGSTSSGATSTTTTTASTSCTTTSSTGDSTTTSSPGTGGTTTTTTTTTTAPYSHLVWSDEFNGASGSAPNPLNWKFDLGDPDAPSNGELETYTSNPANVSLDGQGHLAVTALHQTATGPDGRTENYTSGRLETGGLASFTYGEIEASMKVPAGQGLWPAFWMVGDDISTIGWPASGEIDIMEMLGQNPAKVYGTLHGPLPGAPKGYAAQGTVLSPQSLANGFHTYGVIWAPGTITFTLDGVPYGTITPSSLPASEQWVFDGHPFHLILDLAVGGSWPGSPDASTPFPSTLLVDWVRVYD